MKLHELDAQRQTERVAKVFESHHGQRIDFGAITGDKARSMLKRVRSLIREHRSAPSFHYSERNPDYMKLVMMEQALSAHLKEFDSQQGAVKAAMATGAKAGPLGKAMQAAAAGKPLDQTQRQAMAAMAGGLDKVMSDPTQASRLQQMLKQSSGVAETKKKRVVKESEIQQAQVVMAAQDMVDRLQGMLEDVSEMQFKDVPALTDSIRNDMGVDQATQFQADATAALTTLLQAIQAGKTQMEAAQGVLTGQAPVVPGEADMGAEPGVDASLDLDIDAELPAGGEEEDEEETEVVGLGRERR